MKRLNLQCKRRFLKMKKFIDIYSLNLTWEGKGEMVTSEYLYKY